MEVIRKGVAAVEAIARDPEVASACDRIAELAGLGLLEGIADVIAERLRLAIEHGDRFPGNLATAAAVSLEDTRAGQPLGWGTPDGQRRRLGRAAALAAAEIDRLHHEESRLETEAVLADPETVQAIAEGLADD